MEPMANSEDKVQTHFPPFRVMNSYINKGEMSHNMKRL